MDVAPNRRELGGARPSITVLTRAQGATPSIAVVVAQGPI